MSDRGARGAHESERRHGRRGAHERANGDRRSGHTREQTAEQTATEARERPRERVRGQGGYTLRFFSALSSWSCVSNSVYCRFLATWMRGRRE